MSNISDEFLEIARDLDAVIVKFESPDVKLPLQKLEDASNQVKKAWSGSWLGYHSRIYYRDFHSPPPGARFSQEWGFMDAISNDTRGDWTEYDFDYVKEKIHEVAGQPDLKTSRALAKHARSLIADKRTEIISLIITVQSRRKDSFFG